MPSIPNYLDIFLGKKIKSFRHQMKWPLKKLAQELGVSIQQIQRYEQAVNKVSATLLFDLAKIFRVQVNSFFEGFEENLAPEKNEYHILLIQNNSKDEFIIRAALADFPNKLSIFAIHDINEISLYCRNYGCNNEALYLLKPDLIILDMNIGSAEAMELLKKIKAKKGLDIIPIIIITDDFTNYHLEKSYHLQVNSFIKKSLSFVEYKSQLHEILNYWTNTVILPSKV